MHRTSYDMAPTILFVPGAWHSTVHFVPVRSLLRAHGYATSCPSMPSYGGAAECTRQDDVDVVKAELERLLAEGADVILAGHSYGGMVATEAALAEYSKAARAEKALAGGVIHILYLSALVVQPGMTLFELRVEGAPHRAKFVIDVRELLVSRAVPHTDTCCNRPRPRRVGSTIQERYFTTISLTTSRHAGCLSSSQCRFTHCTSLSRMRVTFITRPRICTARTTSPSYSRGRSSR
jgi:pimeloyl-ACP methyl ester carboxylesterase